MVAAIWSPGQWKLLISLTEWSRVVSGLQASVDWDQSRSVGSTDVCITVLSELRYCNNNNCHLFTWSHDPSTQPDTLTSTTFHVCVMSSSQLFCSQSLLLNCFIIIGLQTSERDVRRMVDVNQDGIFSCVLSPVIRYWWQSDISRCRTPSLHSNKRGEAWPDCSIKHNTPPHYML